MLVSHLQTWATNVFIAVAVIFFWMWDHPREKLPRRLLSRAEWFVNWTGLWHGWGMFAPAPIQVNRRMRVEVELADGSTGGWKMVEVGEMGLLRAVWWGRHRKLQESLLLRKPTVLRPSYCQWVARAWVARHGDRPRPVAVRLYWSMAKVLPPGSPAPRTGDFVEKLLYSWTVPGDAQDAPGADAAVEPGAEAAPQPERESGLAGVA